MDIIDFLIPKFVLMENVVDIIKFANGILGYHAVGRLVAMNYQTRLGIMAAGSYGVSQCRYRVFLWGASTMMVFYFILFYLLLFFKICVLLVFHGL